jgi:hypothetical protein
LLAACGGGGGGGDGGGDSGGGSSPSLTVTQPLDGSLAMTTVPIDVRCVDDRPRCEVDVRRYSERCTGAGCTGVVRDYSEVLARGTGGLATTLDLAPFTGTQVALEFRATDSAGQIATVSRRVYVELPDRLTPITTVGGDIADFDGTRLLYFVHDAAGDHPAIYTLSLGVTETIPLEDGWAVYLQRRLSPDSDAHLTPDGALFRVERPGGEYRVFLWRSGTLTPLPNSERAWEVSVAGPFAIWENAGDFSLHRVDTHTGASELVEPYTVSSADVAADGTVVFVDRDGQLVSDRAGQRTSLAPDGASDPKIEGTSVAFTTLVNMNRSLSLIVDGAAPISLNVPRMAAANYDPQLAGGWVAFTDPNGETYPQVYRRDPQGTISRITDFADGAGLLERLAPNGDAMVYRGGRYLSRGTTLSRIAGGPVSSRSYWFNGQWYITMGATLVSVDTSGL